MINHLRAPAAVSRETEPLVVIGQAAKRAGAIVLVGTGELTRLQDTNCALRSGIPEIFRRRIVLIRSVSFPFPDQQRLYTSQHRKKFLLYFVQFQFYIS
jgi:hypothetical protein